MISAIKLEELFMKHDITIVKYLTIDSKCKFILCYQQCQIFIVCLDNEWMFKTNPSNKVKSISIREVDLENHHSGGGQLKDDLELIKSYEKRNPSFKYDVFADNDVSSSMKEGYKYNIRISKLKDRDVIELNDISKQLDRLSLCVKQERHSLCILYDTYICIIDGNHATKTFKSDIVLSPFRRFSVMSTLDAMFDNIRQTWDDVYQITTGIDEILDRNMYKHIENLRGMIKLHDTVVKKILQTPKAKHSLVKKKNELFHLIRHKNMGSERANIEKEATKISSSLNNLTLACDKILFDNIVMYNSIIKNYEILQSILEPILEN